MFWSLIDLALDSKWNLSCNRKYISSSVSPRDCSSDSVPRTEAGGYLAISHAQYSASYTAPLSTNTGPENKNKTSQNYVASDGVQRTPCTCSPITINMENAQKPLGVESRRCQIKLLRFFCETESGRRAWARRRAAPIVSPDLQRATNTQPDRERNCNENAPSCVITAAGALRNGLPATRRRTTFDFIIELFRFEIARNRSRRVAMRLSTLPPGHKPASYVAWKRGAVYLARIASRSGCFRSLARTAELVGGLPIIDLCYETSLWGIEWPSVAVFRSPDATFSRLSSFRRGLSISLSQSHT